MTPFQRQWSTGTGAGEQGEGTTGTGAGDRGRGRARGRQCDGRLWECCSECAGGQGCATLSNHLAMFGVNLIYICWSPMLTYLYIMGGFPRK